MLQFYQKTFEELTKNELYEILQFRIGIFMLEQKSLYLDLDGKDQDAIHFLGIENNAIVAYGRVNLNANSAEIRRICVNSSLRNKGIGVLLMQNIMAYLETLNLSSASLDAQLHLQGFYAKYGFKPEGEAYDDGGIPHIWMQKFF